MKAITGIGAMAAGVLVVFAAADAPPADPLSLLDQRAAETQSSTQPANFLSPSTQHASRNELDLAIHKALMFLAIAQHENGSWDRVVTTIPETSFNPRHRPSEALEKDAAEADTEEVADTSLSAEAMMVAIDNGRARDLTPRYLQAIDYLCRQVQKSPVDSIYIQARTWDPIHDPHPLSPTEGKNGGIRFYDSTVDTFFTLRCLCEAKNRIEDAARQARVREAIDTLAAKITRSQNRQGSWTDDADPMAGKGFHATNAHRDFSRGPAAFTPGETAFADLNTPNIVTHCVAVCAINVALRHGVNFPAEVSYRSEQYLRDAVEHRATKSEPAEKMIVTVAIAAAQAEAYETYRVLVEEGKRERAKGGRPTIGELDILQTRATAARNDLRAAVQAMLALGVAPTEGPALDFLPEAIMGLRSVDEGGDDYFLVRVAHQLMREQGMDGHLNAVSNPYTRDDNTFGTATAARIFMAAAAARQAAEATTQQ